MSDLKKGKDLRVIGDLKTMTNNDKFNWSNVQRDKQANKHLYPFSEVTVEKVGFSCISSVKLNQ